MGDFLQNASNFDPGKVNFNHATVSFKPENMRYLAWCADLAYKDSAAIHNGLTKAGFTDIKKNYFFENLASDAQGFIVGDADKIILAFRGTEANLEDILADVHAVKTDFSPAGKHIGNVHRGFYDALLSIWGMIEPQLNKLRDNNQSIWITGHSLGGALATLAAATLTFGSPARPVQGLYTFGQPRVGDRDFAGKFNMAIGHRCFRSVNNQDIVTWVPPGFMGFEHIGQLKHFDGMFNLNEHSGSSEKDPQEDAFKEQKIQFSAVSDHRMANYQAAAAKLMSA